MTFRFRKNSSIGSPDAESDERYLQACFVDTGDLEFLSDVSSAPRLVLGRTGAGKSALLRELAKREAGHAVELSPAHLAMNHVANSALLRQFEEAGVNLDTFYQLLWKHVLAIELLRLRYHAKSQASNLWDRLRELIHGDKAKQRAIDYIEKWAPKFWEDTEYRVRDMVQRFEETANASVDLGQKEFGISIQGKASGTNITEVRTDVLQRGRVVVNSLQMQQLSEVVSLLADSVFTDPQKRYFVVIDMLDESWVDERIKLKLIRALLEVVRSFQRIKGAKVVVGLRIDLLRRVFAATRDNGFQEEKFQGLYLNVRWTDRQLKQLLNSRINHLMKDSYSQRSLEFEDVFPHQVGGVKAFDYIIRRTLMRPRDAIAYVNECISLVEGKALVKSSAIKQAEVAYSNGRLQSLADEWYSDYPALQTYVKLFEGQAAAGKLADLPHDHVERFVLDRCTALDASDPILRAAEASLAKSDGWRDLLAALVKTLYSVGFLGIKSEAYNQVHWAFENQADLPDHVFAKNPHYSLHPAYWRALGIRSLNPETAAQ